MSYRRRDPEHLLGEEKRSEKSRAFRPKETRNNSILRLLSWKYLASFLCLWICVIQYYERTVVKRAMSRCNWQKWEQWPKNGNPHRMALLADPQIMDAHSYPGRPQIVNFFTQRIVDNYHARNWKHMLYHLDPDSIFFLGDLFDGGRRWNDSDWMQEYDRFNKIFPKKPNRLTVMSLPGNHDIGFGNTVNEDSLTRFKFYFGDPSSKWEVGNHTIVLLDTISLSDSQNENVSAVPREFLESIASTPKTHPRIMLSHVPLYRDSDVQTCGSKRESKKPFPLAAGEQYQTVIDKELSQEVLEKIQPSILFSGDDHDYCRINHSYSSGNIAKTAEEITVKSCAMNMGISRPAIQLLSLHNPDDTLSSDTYQTEICYMPDPYRSMQVYGITYAATLLFFFWAYFYPQSYDRVSASIMRYKKKDILDLLPIATKKVDARLRRENSSDSIRAPNKLQQFILNGGVMSFIIFLVFVFYYTQI